MAIDSEQTWHLYPSSEEFARSYLDDFCLRGELPRGLADSSAQTPLPGGSLPLVPPVGSRISLRDTVHVSFMSRIQMAACLEGRATPILTGRRPLLFWPGKTRLTAKWLRVVPSAFFSKRPVLIVPVDQMNRLGMIRFSRDGLGSVAHTPGLSLPPRCDCPEDHGHDSMIAFARPFE